MASLARERSDKKNEKGNGRKARKERDVRLLVAVDGGIRET